MDWLVGLLAPLMGILHLPGEAAFPLIAAFAVDDYGVIAAMKAVNITGYALAVISVMTMISHAIIMEAAISKKIGLSVMFFTTYRLTASIIVGLILSTAGVMLDLW